MANYEALRKATHNAVIGRPFTRILGLSTWEQKETFLEEAENTAMEMVVTYDWADDHGLLPEIIGQVKFLLLTLKNYVAPVQPPVVPPKIPDQSATDKEGKIHGRKRPNEDELRRNRRILVRI